MQPPGFASRVAVGAESDGLEGDSRPGHFEGVATVVAQLIARASPDVAYFGQKDAQQVAVVRRMTRDLGFPTRIRSCPIARAGDGVALSSRNVYLQPADRVAAAVLFRALSAAESAHTEGVRDAGRLVAAARQVLDSEPAARVDYLELRTFPDLLAWPVGQPVHSGCLLVAARFGSGDAPTRLLDNITLGRGIAMEGYIEH